MIKKALKISCLAIAFAAAITAPSIVLGHIRAKKEQTKMEIMDRLNTIRMEVDYIGLKYNGIFSSDNVSDRIYKGYLFTKEGKFELTYDMNNDKEIKKEVLVDFKKN